MENTTIGVIIAILLIFLLLFNLLLMLIDRSDMQGDSVQVVRDISQLGTVGVGIAIFLTWISG